MEITIEIPKSFYSTPKYWNNFIMSVVYKNGGWPTEHMVNFFLKDYNGKFSIIGTIKDGNKSNTLHFDSEEDFLLFKLTFS